jgi:hypothetical protein
MLVNSNIARQRVGGIGRVGIVTRAQCIHSAHGIAYIR